MCLALISATIPCLRIFLGAFESGLLGPNATMLMQSQMATKGSATKGSSANKSLGNSGTRNFSGLRSSKRRASLELTELGERGTSYANATAGGGDSISMASDSSQKAIVVKQAVDVQYDKSDMI